MKEEILSAAVSQLKAKVDAIMLEINIMISNPSFLDGLADKVASKITELSIADAALRQATGLFAQAIAYRLSDSELSKKDNSTIEDPEKNKEE